MKKLISSILLVTIGVLSISGCTAKPQKEFYNNVFIEELNSADLEGDFFYDVFSQTISAWSHDEILQKNSWKDSEYKSVMAYCFDDLSSDLITIGDSYKGTFGIAKHKTGNYFQQVYSSSDESKSIVPIGHNENSYLFSVVDERVSDRDSIQFEILEYKSDNTFEVHKWFQNLAPPLSGVFVNKWFYFTVYNYQSKLYDLYKWEYSNEESAPILIDSNLDDMKVFLENEKIVYSNNNCFEFSNCKIPMTGDTKLYQFQDTILQFINMTQNSKCIIYNLHNGKERTIKDAVGVSTIGSTLSIYTLNGSRIKVQ